MAIIRSEYPFVATTSGVFERKRKGDTTVVVRTIYGQTIANKITYSDAPETEKQLANQARFSYASGMASADMADPDKKAEWQQVAEYSRGKYKTARGAAFASYYANYTPEE